MQKRLLGLFLVSLLIGHSCLLRAQEMQDPSSAGEEEIELSPLMMFRMGAEEGKKPTPENRIEREERETDTTYQPPEEETGGLSQSNFSSTIAVPTSTELDEHVRADYRTLQALHVAIEQRSEIELKTAELSELQEQTPKTSYFTKKSLANDRISAARKAWNKAQETAGSAEVELRRTQNFSDPQIWNHFIETCNGPKIAWREAALFYEQAIVAAQAAAFWASAIAELDTLYKEAQAEAAIWTTFTRHYEYKQKPSDVTWTKVIKAYEETLLIEQQINYKAANTLWGHRNYFEDEVRRKQIQNSEKPSTMRSRELTQPFLQPTPRKKSYCPCCTLS